jgi:hypothetical protein
VTRKKNKSIRLKRRSVRALDEHALEKATGGGKAPPETTNCLVLSVRLSGGVINHNQHLREVTR